MDEPAIFGSDLVVEALAELGLRWVALNPGASFRGLHDSLVNHPAGRELQIITCLHEGHAAGLAHGYAKVADRPIAVAVHANVGLMQATMGIFDAWCDRAPMLVLGATGPVDAAQRRPWIDWIHTTADQGALVRDYTKWDDAPASPAAAVESLRRAMALTQSRPCGPVYINLDAALQEQRLEKRPALHPAGLFPPAPQAAPQADAVTRAAQMLIDARRPVVLCGRSTRSEAAWRARVALVERVGGQAVTHVKLPAAFPTAHPAHVGQTGHMMPARVRATLEEADAVLALDWLDPGGFLDQVYPPGTPRPPVIHASNDYQLHRGWNADYCGLPAVDLHLPVTSEATVDALLDALGGAAPAAPAAAGSAPTAGDGEGPITMRDLAAAFAVAAHGRDLCVTGQPLGWPLDATAIDHPLGFLGHSGGGGVGAGPSIAVGAALALRDQGVDRLAVAILGDGDYAMGVTALWNAASLKLPLLVIVANNRSYYNDEHHQIVVARKRGRDESRAWVGQRMDEPPLDLGGLARAQGLEAPAQVTDLAALPGALAAALERAHGGATIVLDVLVEPGFDTRSMRG